MLSGTAVYDLTDCKPDRMRNRLASVPDVPFGARIIVNVGALAPEPDAVRVLALHERRLQICVHGTPRAVRLWVDAVGSNLGEVLIT